MISRFLAAPLALAVVACAFSSAAGAKQHIDSDASVAAAPALTLTATTTDRLIVKYRSGTGAYPTARGRMAAQVAANRHGVQVSHLRQTAGGAQVFRLNRPLAAAELDTLAASLQAGDPNIEFAEPDLLMQPTLLPNDALLAQQWALVDAIGGVRAPAAWDRARGNGITVAVIDTGVRPHADLVANLLPGYDFITDTKLSGDGNARDADASDPGDAVAAGYCGSGSVARKSSWHGTHVAGIIAASAGNGAGVAGVAHGAKLLPLRVLGRCGGYSSDIADAMVWAVGGTVAGLPVNPNPARVLNLSLGGRAACGQTTQNAINTARSKGAVVVVAAGNENSDAATSAPANCAGVVVVAATGKSGGKASYSNTGAIVTLAAPGGDAGAGILSTLNSGSSTPGADSYVSYIGTSMATPAVAGVAALMLSVNKTLTPDQVTALLKSSARAFPAACAKCGAGLVDANAALLAAAATAGAAAPTTAPDPTTAAAPLPASSAAAVAEVEPNDSLAKAQVIALLPATLAGTLASTGDLDHVRVTLPAGKKLSATLSAASSSAGFGLSIYSGSGQALLVVPGVAGRQVQIAVSNGGSVATPLVFRVSRSTGATGAYKLQLAY